MQLISDRYEQAAIITLQTQQEIPINRNRSISQFGNNKQNIKKFRSQYTISYFSHQSSYEDKTAIPKDPKGTFIKIVKKLIIILSFFESLEQYRKDKLQQRLEFYFKKRTSIIPFYPDDYYIIIWQKIIQTSHFFGCILLPLQIAFDNIYFLYLLSLLLDIIFGIDILITFLTAYIDDLLILHFKLNEIGYHYIIRFFIFDLISILPINKFCKFYRIIKFFLYKPKHNYKGQIGQQNLTISFQPEVQYLKIKEGIKFIVYVIITTILLIHIFACINLYVLDENYLDSFYYSTQTITTIGYADNPKQVPYELQITWLIIGVGYYAFTIGDFTFIVQKTGINQDQEYHNQLDSLSYHIYLPEKIKGNLRRFINTNLNNNSFWTTNYKNMVNQLPFTLQNYLILSGMLQICQTIPFFLYDINFTKELLKNVQFIIVEQNDIIYRQGQLSNEIYFLLSGEVRIMNKNKLTLLNIFNGTLFGEQEAIELTPRINFAVAIKTSFVLVINYSILQNSMKNSPNLTFEVQQLYKRRKQLINHIIDQNKFQRRRVKRSVVILFSHEQLKITSMEAKYQREKYYLKNINENSQILLQELIGQKKQKYKNLLKRFKLITYRIIDMNQQLKRTPPEEWRDLDDFHLIKIIFPLQYLSEKFNKFKIRRSSPIYPKNKTTLSKQFFRKFTYKYKYRLSDIQIKKIIENHNKYNHRHFPSFENIINNLETKSTIISSPQRIRKNYSKLFKNVDEDDYTNEQLEELKWKVDQIHKRLDRINKIWTKGSIIKFDLFQKKSQKNLDNISDDL